MRGSWSTGTVVPRKKCAVSVNKIVIMAIACNLCSTKCCCHYFHDIRQWRWHKRWKMEANVAKRSAALLRECGSHSLGCTAKNTCCVWLLNEVQSGYSRWAQHAAGYYCLIKKFQCLSIYWHLSQFQERFCWSLGRQYQLVCRSVPPFRGCDGLRDLRSWHRGVRKIPALFGSFNYLVYDSSPLAPILCHINIDRPHLQYLAVNIHINIILGSSSGVLQVIPFIQVFNRTLWASPISPMRYTFPTHLLFLDLITPIFGAEYQTRISSN